jgi:hypothetical protein
MSDFFGEVERELRLATARRAHLPWYMRIRLRPAGAPARVRVVAVALVLVLAMTAIGLAATGVILTGAPVQPAIRPLPSAGEGIPVVGATRLLPLRAADPAGGLPWGMRIVHTTRGLVCVQIGRVDHGELGQLGIDGAFGNDGRFHALAADALPDVVRSLGVFFENCAAPEDTYAGDIVGLQASAASDPRAGVGPAADRREISFGLLGKHAVSITYRAGSETHTQRVLQGLGAYLIVQRYTSGRPLGSVSESDGSDQPYPYSQPTGPNGALTAITYDYAGRMCTDTGRGRILHACGLSEVPPRAPVLPATHEPLRLHLQIHGDVLTAVDVAFKAPYAITNATQRYDVSVSARGCYEVGGVLGTDHDLARGTAVSISAPLAARAPKPHGVCGRTLTIEVSFLSFLDNNIQHTTIGTASVREPAGTHPAPPRPPPRL